MSSPRQKMVVASPQPSELEQKKKRQTLERAKANHVCPVFFAPAVRSPSGRDAGSSRNNSRCVSNTPNSRSSTAGCVRSPIRVRLVLTAALGPATTKPQRGRKPLLSPFPPPEHATGGAATTLCDRDHQLSTRRTGARRDADARRPVPSTVGGGA